LCVRHREKGQQCDHGYSLHRWEVRGLGREVNCELMNARTSSNELLMRDLMQTAVRMVRM
jgi:hypothetical protein